MAGDNAVRSLLEKMAQCASNAYLGILERYSLNISSIDTYTCTDVSTLLGSYSCHRYLISVIYGHPQSFL